MQGIAEVPEEKTGNWSANEGTAGKIDKYDCRVLPIMQFTEWRVESEEEKIGQIGRIRPI